MASSHAVIGRLDAWLLAAVLLNSETPKDYSPILSSWVTQNRISGDFEQD
jgi:hypothetical protein